MAPLRRTRGDLIATGVITAVSLAAVAGVWWTAPIRSSQLTPAVEEHVAAPPLTEAPATLEPAWSLTDTPLPGVTRPVIVDGLTITYADHTVTASTPEGEPVWTYRRDLDLCSLGAAWGRVVTTWRAGNGCGDVVSIDATTGQYQDTRSAISPDEVVAASSNDRVGTVGTSRLELWRSDLVRTVEYGYVEALQEPHLQPNPGCRITSALTRTELLAVTEVCDDGTWLRLQDATPESSREPEVSGNVALTGADAHLVAVGQEAAAVLDDGVLVSYSASGEELARQPVTGAAPRAEGLPFAPVTGDLPEHITVHLDGRLLLLNPESLQVEHVLEGALGTGVALGQRMLLPVREGIAVVDWRTGETEKTIPLDRGGYEGMVTLGVAGETVVEKRGDTVVGLRAPADQLP